MRKIQMLVALLALLAFSGSSVLAAEESNTIQLVEQNNSGQSGTASFTLSEDNKTLTVEINLSNGTSEPQPAHIHAGTCADLNPKPFYPLNSVVNGKSVTVITEESVAGLDYDLYNQFAINVHKSAAEASVYVACGDIVPGGTEVGMPQTGNSSSDAPLMVLIALSLIVAGTALSFSRRSI
jgi:hypothetical protein